MSEDILKIENLKISYIDDGITTRAIKNINLNLAQGQSLGIIGESGSGKTSIANKIMQILSKNTKVEGKVYYKGLDITKMTEKQRTNILGNEIAIIFQNSLDALNPVMTVGSQIQEVLVEHKGLNKKESEEISRKYIEKVGLKNQVYEMYPHELSGGMRQRVLIAMAIVSKPNLLIADELTSALDAKTKSEILDLIDKLQKELKFSLLLISHELDTVSRLTENIIVLYKGEILEEGLTKEVLNYQYHPYTRGLINSSTAINIYKDLWGIPTRKDKKTNEKSCPFYNRCTQRIDICGQEDVELKTIVDKRKIACHRDGIIELLKCNGLEKTFKREKSQVKACNDCSLYIRHGEFISLVGESGSGKTTLASILSGIIKQDSGEVYFKDQKITDNKLGQDINQVQIVFQDPFSSINEKFTILESISEPLIINKDKTDIRALIEAEKINLEEELKEISNDENKKMKIIDDKQAIKMLVKKELEKVELDMSDEFLNRKIHTLSGGQRQRVALARALIMKPELLIGDEICSMLDKSTEANILRLLKKLQNENGFAMIYITHNLGVALKLSDRILVMNEGEIIERGNSVQIMKSPKHEYTKRLIELNNKNEALLY